MKCLFHEFKAIQAGHEKTYILDLMDVAFVEGCDKGGQSGPYTYITLRTSGASCHLTGVKPSEVMEAISHIQEYDTSV